MPRKIKFHTLFLYLFLILSATGFTACHHRHKAIDHPIVNEMPLPNADNYYYTPASSDKDVVSKNEHIFTVIEQMPQFPGGEEELMNFISTNLVYPGSALKDGIQGKVICRFVVTKTGRVESPEVVRSLDPACDKEAISVVKSLTRFIPGRQNGVNVSVWYVLPVVFKHK
jgi:TonB family protein